MRRCQEHHARKPRSCSSRVDGRHNRRPECSIRRRARRLPFWGRDRRCQAVHGPRPSAHVQRLLDRSPLNSTGPRPGSVGRQRGSPTAGPADPIYHARHRIPLRSAAHDTTSTARTVRVRRASPTSCSRSVSRIAGTESRRHRIHLRASVSRRTGGLLRTPPCPGTSLSVRGTSRQRRSIRAPGIRQPLRGRLITTKAPQSGLASRRRGMVTGY